MSKTFMFVIILWMWSCFSNNLGWTFQLRLVNGTDSSGRVEVNFNDGDGWGTVCDDHWDNNDAKVVCRSLGYRYYTAYRVAKFGQGTGSIKMDDVNCTGSETSLNECEYNKQANCGHNEDASVVCSELIVKLRLADGGANFLGRVEVNLDDGTGWGTVCDDAWDANDAKVVCRSLGLPYSTAIPVESAFFGLGKGLIHMDNVGCTGSENGLHNCQYVNSTNENCGHGEDAGVVCLRLTQGAYVPVIENKDSRIAIPRDGGLKARLTNGFSLPFSVCLDRYTNATIQVACNEKFNGRYYSKYRVATYDSQDIKRTPLCLQFNCTGRENRLSQCPASVLHGSRSYIPPGILCGYDRVSSIAIRSERMMGRFIIMEKGDKTNFQCETDYARPEPSISWFMDGDVFRYGSISSWSNISGSTYKKQSNLSIYPNDFYHGRPLKCCSNDTFGNSVCSSTYSLFVIETSKILNNLNLAQPDQLEQPTTESLKVTSNAPLPQKSQYVTETTNIHIPVLYALAGCALLIPSVLIFVLRRKMPSEQKPTGQTKKNTEDLELENYENVLTRNDPEDAQELYDVPDINT